MKFGRDIMVGMSHDGMLSRSERDEQDDISKGLTREMREIDGSTGEQTYYMWQSLNEDITGILNYWRRTSLWE